MAGHARSWGASGSVADLTHSGRAIKYRTRPIAVLRIVHANAVASGGASLITGAHFAIRLYLADLILLI